MIYGEADRVVDSISLVGVGAAGGYRGVYGLEAAVTARWARVSLAYDDADRNYERSGVALGARGAKTWSVGRGWSLGVELAAEVTLVDDEPTDPERPLVWTYRARAVVVRD